MKTTDATSDALDVRRLNMENAFLKKASAYFASQNL